jgi:Protein of unknown function (DUF3822)
LIPSIKILPANTEQLQSSGYHLIVVTGSNDWQFALLNKEHKSIDSVIGFHFDKAVDEKDFAAKWDAVMDEYPFLNKFYSTVTVVYVTAETAILPGKEFNEQSTKTVLDTLYAEKDNAVIKTDFVVADDLQVAYRVPSSINNIIQRAYINADSKHYYSRELTALAKSGYDNIMLVNFFGGHFTVCLLKERKLQLMQLYEYRQPEDVLFYLLTIAREFDCNREEMALVIGGMVDEKSALFNELKKYFLNISLSAKPETISCTKAFEEFPLHYFHSLFTTALCV